MPLRYGEALRDVTLSQIMGVIQLEKDFKWINACIKVTEPENNVKFDVFFSKDLSEKKQKEWEYVESLYAKDKFEARRHRRMKRYPEHNYGVIVNFVKDEKPVVRVHYLWDDKNPKIAELSMKMKIVEDYLEFKGFETSDEVSAFIHEKEMEADRDYMNRQKIAEIKRKYYGRR